MRLFLAVLALLVAAPAAHAGGFATVGLGSTPSGPEWTVEITVLQHGVTPLDGVTPHVDIASGATTRTFAARPTGKPGVYRAEVVFPKAGDWEYVVLDGFNDQLPHTFPAVRIGDGAASPAAPSPASAPAPAPAPDDGGIAAGWLWGAGAALVLALALLAGDRLRRRPAPAPRGAEPA